MISCFEVEFLHRICYVGLVILSFEDFLTWLLGSFNLGRFGFGVLEDRSFVAKALHLEGPFKYKNWLPVQAPCFCNPWGFLCAGGVVST